MQRIGLCAAVAGTAVMLALGTTTSAYAASGTFVYTLPTGQLATLENPVTGKCYNVTGIKNTLNKTDAYALLYAERSCAGTHAVELDPHAQHYEAEFKSVKFID
ncbi:hypothetical protein [Streptomyces paludis]|uniref:Uncharacterized protein n=1 Tax=Streptomyces paludis TaxID=2282738 RepID=A0A345HQQ0_9ACTN|nr:hypothetical protein [Streptomyces paludis]AXG79024.1 hypothetical protein DVK44_16485 [Streptomyces paludis]